MEWTQEKVDNLYGKLSHKHQTLAGHWQEFLDATDIQVIRKLILAGQTETAIIENPYSGTWVTWTPFVYDPSHQEFKIVEAHIFISNPANYLKVLKIPIETAERILVLGL